MLPNHSQISYRMKEYVSKMGIGKHANIVLDLSKYDLITPNTRSRLLLFLSSRPYQILLKAQNTWHMNIQDDSPVVGCFCSRKDNQIIAG